MAAGLIGVLLIAALALSTRRTVSIGALLVMIPFQMVDTRYGSSSVLLAYVLAAILILTSEFKIRMLLSIGLILLAYLASMSLADRDLLMFHAIFIFQLSSCFVVFLLAYNFALLVKEQRSTLNVLHAINVLIVIYCLLQMTAGPGERFVPFGIDALQFNMNRQPHDPRLVGAFDNPGSTAGYFMLASLVCAFDFMFSTGRRKYLLALLIGFNVLGLVATGNRSNFLVLVMLYVALMYLFRRELGAGRILGYIVGGTAALAIAAGIAIFYTDFDRLFARLETVTETEGGIPATRQGGWPVAIAKIKEKPWFGEGPYFWTAEDAEKTGQLRAEYDESGDIETAYDPYPHSLYLFLLRTVGICGLIAVLGFFIRAWFILRKSTSVSAAEFAPNGFVRLGLVLIPAFLISQITLEFIRTETMDYGQFILALMGLLIGTADRSWRAVPATRQGVLEQQDASHGKP